MLGKLMGLKILNFWESAQQTTLAAIFFSFAGKSKNAKELIFSQATHRFKLKTVGYS